MESNMHPHNCQGAGLPLLPASRHGELEQVQAKWVSQGLDCGYLLVSQQQPARTCWVSLTPRADRISGVTKYSPLRTETATPYLPFGDLATLHFSGRWSLPNSFYCTLSPEFAALKIRHFPLIFRQILKAICPWAALALHSHELTYFLGVLSLKMFL